MHGSTRPCSPALANQNGLLLSKPTTMLLLGRDHENTDRRVGLNNSDSIMILRTDPSRHRLVYLSIPRDLRVPIPGHGEDRINAAFPLGGAALTIRTIEGLTGLAINHVMIVDFRSFKSLIDNIGGVDINVPAPILSNKFDCPYKASACARWQGYRFHKGMQHMNGQRALIYSRIRENQLNPADSDITRGLRQQAVMRAVMAKLLGAEHRPAPAVQRRLAPEAPDDRSQCLAVHAARMGAEARRPEERCPLPARRDADVDRRRVRDRRQRGQPLGGADGHRPRGTSAAPAGLGSIRAGLRHRQPAVRR